MIGKNICYFVLYIVEALIAFQYMERLFSKKQTRAMLCLGFSCGYLLLFLVSMLNIVAANAVAFAAVNYAILVWGYRCGRKTALLHAVFLDFAMSIAEVLVNLILSRFGVDFSAYMEDFSAMIILIALSKLLYLAFAVIGSRIFTTQKRADDEPKLVLLFCSLPLFSTVFAVVIVYIGTSHALTDTSAWIVAITVLALLAINLIFMVIYNHLQFVNAEYLALQLSLQKEEADIAYYTALREQAESQRILIHDIKNHLQTIRQLASLEGSEAIIQYVASLSETLTPTEQVRMIPDPILNFILLRFRESCKSNAVDFQYDIRENDFTFMDAPSITALFENLLSNALEAASLSQDRYIELSIVRNMEQNTLTISVINSCDQKPDMEKDGTYKTAKKKAGFHGIGLKSINRVVKKYNGIASTWYNSATARFYHVIQFPN